MDGITTKSNGIEGGITKIAHRHLKIQVRQANIDKSVPRDSHHCMIADAIMEQVKSARNVSVDIATIRFTDKKLGQRFIYLTPPTAQQSLVDFDQGTEVKPFNFDLRTAIQVKQRQKSSRAKRSRAAYQKKKLVLASAENESHQPVVVIGGHEPPTASLSNTGTGRITARIRRFGAHNLKP